MDLHLPSYVAGLLTWPTLSLVVLTILFALDARDYRRRHRATASERTVVMASALTDDDRADLAWLGARVRAGEIGGPMDGERSMTR